LVSDTNRDVGEGLPGSRPGAVAGVDGATRLGHMPSGSEWIIVLVIVLLVFGGSQLPKLAKNLGKAQKEFKDGLAEGMADSDESTSSSSGESS
jgi:sec-independent protein translocase protein TatA